MNVGKFRFYTNQLKRKGKCNQCGKCCEVVCLGIDLNKVYESNLKEFQANDRIFCKKFFIPITKEKAYEINPHLKNWGNKLSYERDFFFYKCILYSKGTKRCKLYNYRTRLCIGFPWYDREINIIESFYSESCGYKVDVKLQKLKNILCEILKKRLKNI